MHRKCPLVLYQAPQQPTLAREDVALLAFLNRFGVDIVFYNPTGKLDLEKYLQEDTFDGHRLEHMVFDYNTKNRSSKSLRQIK